LLQNFSEEAEESIQEGYTAGRQGSNSETSYNSQKPNLENIAEEQGTVSCGDL
jgi:hypothetical protein